MRGPITYVCKDDAENGEKKGFSRKHRLSPVSQSDESGNEMLKSWVNVKGGEKRSESHRGMTGLGVPR